MVIWGGIGDDKLEIRRRSANYKRIIISVNSNLPYIRSQWNGECHKQVHQIKLVARSSDHPPPGKIKQAFFAKQTFRFEI